MMYTNFIYGIIFLLIQVCNTVKITNLKVPSTYVIENTPATAKGGKSTLKNRLNHLILDCEYEIDAGEQGFVLKWLLNNHMIYQWIPTRTPFAVSSFKGHLNTTYRASEDDQHRHRAMAITRPMWNISGEYTCSVHTFQSEDKKSAFLQIIVPESDFQLQYRTDPEGFVNIRCYAYDISPEPYITIILGSNKTFEMIHKSKKGTNGLFTTSASGKIAQQDIKPETTINCILSIPGTNYTRKRETIYYEQQPTSTDWDIEEISSGIFSLGIESKQKAAASSPEHRSIDCAMLLLFVFLMNFV